MGNRQDNLGNRQDNRGDRLDNRQDNLGDRQDNRGDRLDNRQDNRGDRQDNRGDRIDNRQDNRGDRVDNRQDHRANRIDNRQEYRQNRVERRNDVRNHFRNYPTHLPAYGAGYWGRHPGWHWGWHNHAENWWKWATAATVTGWVVGGLTSSEPVYYNYGTSVYYEGDTVYQEGEPVASAEEYAAQAQTIAESVPEVEPDQVEWMPLGVFALTQDGEATGPEPTIFLQLAISKEGIIAGTVQNTATDNSAEVEGTIDQESQRAAWGPTESDWPIMETGIYNLTEDDASALLHFEDGTTQQWLLVRLEDPEGSGETN